MDPATETETANGTPPATTEATLPPTRGRRRAVGTAPTTSPTTGDASAQPKKRRGPAKGFKRKSTVAATAFDPQTLPDPATLPISYLIKCGTVLKEIRKQLTDLAE